MSLIYAVPDFLITEFPAVRLLVPLVVSNFKYTFVLLIIAENKSCGSSPLVPLSSNVTKESVLAYINDINVTAANRQNSTLTVQFTGTGPLS